MIKNFLTIQFNADDDLPFFILPKMFVLIMNNMKMLHEDRIDVHEGIDVNETKESKECDICQY